MRAFLILCVAAFTLLTFYSALWFKSEDIQADITDRVTQDLTTANAKDVAVDVDGRHVTLTGVVYDQATETEYLDTANKTYGALGPIDGLTYLTGGGFVKAVKSDAGIVLNGTVPSKNARDALVAAATEATQGEVTDNLSIGGSAGDWEAEAGYGVAKLADLSQGALAVSPGSYTLSGLATGDATTVQADLAGRDGWQAFVSSPAVEADLTQEVNRLKADASTLDQTIVGLTGERDTLGKSLGDLTSQRDALTASLAAVNGDYKAVADARDAAVADRDTLSVARDAVVAERDTLSAARDAAIAERDTALGERDTAQDDLAKLRASLDDNQTNAASLAADLATATTGLAERDSTIDGLNGQVANLTSANTDLTAQLEAQKSALNADQQEVVSLKSKIDVQTATIQGLTKDLDAKTGELAAVQGNLGTLSTDGDAAKAKIADLTSTLEERDQEEARLGAQVTDLTGKLADSEAQVATLTGQLAEQNTGDAAAAAGLAAATANLDAQTAKVDTLNKQVGDLTATVAERDATIVSLQNVAPVTVRASLETAQQCSARAGEILESAQINFATGTANIDRRSVPTLERLTGIALACSDSGLNVEIGGHTDSQGSDANNQALSERRANAVATFMAERGVPTGTLQAVGYGEAKPIGDNATSAGRAQNRRISFEWQAR